MAKLFKTENFLFQVFIQGLKHYYKDVLNLTLGNKNCNCTFNFLNNSNIETSNKHIFNCIDIIENFEKDILIKLNLELSLFNLFHNLKPTV